jgi:general stress protein 26
MDASIKNAIDILIEDSKSAVVCSLDEDGFPNAKKMYTVKNEGIKTFWFSSNISAIRTQQWLKNAKSSIYFYNDTNVRGLMLKAIFKYIQTTQPNNYFGKMVMRNTIR